MGAHYDPREIKRRLSFLDIAAHEGLEARRAGNLHAAICPFHLEKSGSFTIYTYPNSEQDHAHCFGCGWNGDIIDFWRERRGCDFANAVLALASLASLPPSVFRAKQKCAAKMPRMTCAAGGEKEKPSLPRVRRFNEAEIEALAALRGLDSQGITAAERQERIAMCEWPQYQINGTWRVAADAAPCWVVTDKSKRVAQFRRLDGAKFVRKEGKEIKAWTKGSPTWPLGASAIGDRGAVLVVEGGADMLAAFHFLALFNRVGTVAICAMLGASCAICDAALPFFAGKRVRIIMHVDTAGVESAGRWTNQLTNVGAAVESFSLAGLVRRDGQSVSDLNDLALCDESIWHDEEQRSAFFDFDF